jgi:hypothetical protein
VAVFPRRKEWPEELTLTVVETFFIASEKQGAVALGHLAGSGALRPGDLAVVDGREWPIVGLEGFKRMYKEVGPNTNVGICFGTGAPKETFAGKTLSFRRRA